MPTTTEATIDKLEREARARFAEFNRAVEFQLSQLVASAEDLTDTQIRTVYRRQVESFADKLVGVFIQGAQISADEASEVVGTVLSFSVVTPEAQLAFQELRNRVINGLIAQQEEALFELRRRAAEVVPIRSFKEVRETITLTGRQVRAINRYQEALESGSVQALSRELRDRRFDSTVRRAAANKVPLTEDQITRMVDRYRERQLSYRAKTIAATEAVRIANESDHTFYEQAVTSGDLAPEQVVRSWVTSKDEKVRSSHRSLNGKKKPGEQPWVSGNGSALRFPGDPRAPARDTINCRCWVETNIIEQSSDVAA